MMLHCSFCDGVIACETEICPHCGEAVAPFYLFPQKQLTPVELEAFAREFESILQRATSRHSVRIIQPAAQTLSSGVWWSKVNGEPI